MGRTGDSRGMFDLLGAQLDADVELGAQVLERPRVLFSEAFDEVRLGPGALEEFAVTFDAANARVEFARKQSRKVRRLHEDAASVPTLEGDDTLQAAFHRNREKVQMLLILSPT